MFSTPHMFPGKSEDWPQMESAVQPVGRVMLLQRSRVPALVGV